MIIYFLSQLNSTLFFVCFCRICSRHNVKNFALTHDPGNYRNIVIGVENKTEDLEKDFNELNNELTSKNIGFTITVETSSSHLYTKFHAPANLKREKWENPNWVNASSDSACELFVEAVERRRVAPENSVYSVGPAHVVIDPEMHEEFSNAGQIENARRGVEQFTTNHRCVLHQQNDGDRLDIGYPPLMCYRIYCWVKENIDINDNDSCPNCWEIGERINELRIETQHIETSKMHQEVNAKGNFDKIRLCSHLIMNDVMFLPLARDNAHKWIKKFRYNNIYKVNTIGELRSLHGKKIRIKNYKGHMSEIFAEYHRSVEGHNKIFGFHVQFTITTGEGSIRQ